MTQTITQEAHALAQNLIVAQAELKALKDSVAIMKDELLQLMLDNETVDKFYEFNEGTVRLVSQDKYSLPDGLSEEVKPQVRNPEQLSQDVVEMYFKNKLDLNKAGKKAIANSEDPDLSSMVVVESVDKIKIELVELA